MQPLGLSANSGRHPCWEFDAFPWGPQVHKESLQFSVILFECLMFVSTLIIPAILGSSVDETCAHPEKALNPKP